MGDAELEAVQRRIDQARRELEELIRRREVEAVEALPPEERRRRWQVITGGAVGATLGWVAARVKDPLTYTVAITAALVAGLLLLPRTDEQSPPIVLPPPVTAPPVEPMMPVVTAEIHEDELEPDEPASEAALEPALSLDIESADSTGVEANKPPPAPPLSVEPEPTPSAPEPEPGSAPEPEPEPPVEEEPEPPDLNEQDKCLDVDTPRIDLGECIRKIIGLLD